MAIVPAPSAELVRKAPTPLRLHAASGRWIASIGGKKVKYFGFDKPKAEEAYAAFLREREENPPPVALPTAPPAALSPEQLAAVAAILSAQKAPAPSSPKAEPKTPRAKGREKTVGEVAAEMLDAAAVATEETTIKGYRSSLKRFLSRYGKRPLSALTTKDLYDFRTALIKQGLRHNSINPTFVLVRRLLNLAYDLDYVPVPFKMKKALESVPATETVNKALSVDEVNALVRCVWQRNSNLARLLLLQYWAVLRPCEVSRLVYQEGEWDKEEEGVFILSKGKTDKSAGERRRVVLTPQALALLKQIRPECPGNYALGQAVRKMRDAIKAEGKKPPASPMTPHPLRHSAQTHLVRAGVIREHVECAAGHVCPRFSGSTPRMRSSGRERQWLSCPSWFPCRRWLRLSPSLGGSIPREGQRNGSAS